MARGRPSRSSAADREGTTKGARDSWPPNLLDAEPAADRRRGLASQSN